jgi:hypothetical protein
MEAVQEERRAMKWSMRSPLALFSLIVMVLTLPAWAGERVPDLPLVSADYPPTGYSHKVQPFPVELYWRCTRPDSSTLHLEGVAANPWSDEPVQLLGFDLVGVDARGRTASSASIDARGVVLDTNQPAPFKIDLHTSGSETRFDLYYQYLYQDNGGHGRLLDWVA